ncbi:PqqD family protein [Jiulongibacter sediminis]|uniref:Thymidylate synthase n=1 Tax=Jiulongibacter sediminis TaxID=1605367 RepID=A0A0P7BWW3_9BACT|nr:PqqD family protein [Jiulongibacter sediminis]KPM49425.1 hypothetical protein AFM12_02070 [Jiulongibacter sediminis]TBX26473.1 hypothetical protein TK44_02075 [Jiulongibacter sediminis]
MSTKYKLSDQQVSTSFSEESVILNHTKGTYYNLNEVGTLIWNVLQKQEADAPFLAEKVAEEYDVSAHECLPDIQSVLDDLVNEQLVEKIQ